MSSKRRRGSRLPDGSEPRRLGSDILTSHVGISRRSKPVRSRVMLGHAADRNLWPHIEEGLLLCVPDVYDVNGRSATIAARDDPSGACTRTMNTGSRKSNRSTSISHRTWPMV
jgi:hypothetical protein